MSKPKNKLSVCVPQQVGLKLTSAISASWFCYGRLTSTNWTLTILWIPQTAKNICSLKRIRESYLTGQKTLSKRCYLSQTTFLLSLARSARIKNQSLASKKSTRNFCRWWLMCLFQHYNRLKRLFIKKRGRINASGCLRFTLHICSRLRTSYTFSTYAYYCKTNKAGITKITKLGLS